MLKFINLYDLMRYFFDQECLGEKAATMMQALLEARSPRLSQIAEKSRGSLRRTTKRCSVF